MGHRLRFEQWIPVPLGTVFRFFSDPENLPRLMPPELAAALVSVRIVPPPGTTGSAGGSPAAGEGSEITLSVRLVPAVPLRTSWVARIVEFEAGRHFTDVQVTGPFRRWRHRHEFETQERGGCEGTVVRDLLEYEVGLGALGDLARRVFIDRRIEGAFAKRQARLRELLSQG